MTSASALQLVAANNLSDLANVATARSNLGLSSGDDVTFGTFAAAAATIGEINTGVLRITDGAFTGSILASLTASRNWAVPDHDGDFVLTGDTDTVTSTMLAGSIALSKLSITGTPNGTKYLRDDGTWQTISTGLTIGSTAITGGTSGRLLYNNAGVVGELALGTGVQTGLGNATDAASGLLTYGIIGTSGAKVPLLNAANTFSETLAQSTGTITTSKPISITQTWNNSGTAFRGLLIDITGTAFGNPTSALIEAKLSGTTRFFIDHGGSCWFGSGTSAAASFVVDTNNQGVDIRQTNGYLTYSGRTYLYCQTLGVLDQRNGTSAQVHRIANTWTSSTNNEYFVIDWQTTANTAPLVSD